MKKWIARIGLTLLGITLLGAVGTYFFVKRATAEMFGANTALAEAAVPAPETGRVVITNAKVLTPAADAFVAGQSVILASGKIAYVGDKPDMSGSPRIVDGSGMYLVPGFTDSHVHLWQSENDLLLYVANGVTQVREMHGQAHHLEWRDEIADGRLGPKLFVTAAQLATYDFLPGIWQGLTSGRNVVRSDEDVRQTVNGLLEDGYDGLKASSYLSLSAYKAASRETKTHSARFVGHLPVAASLDDLWTSNQQEVAHVEEFVKALDREFGGYTSQNTDDFLAFVASRSADVARKVRERDMAVTSTLAIIDSFVRQKTDLETTLRAVSLEDVNPGVVEGQAMGWLPANNIYRVPQDYRTKDWKERQQAYWSAYAQAQNILFRELLKANATIFAGTDANVPVMVPGFSLHDEMKAMQAAGMSPAQVLASATLRPDAWMGVKSGQIREGYDADLVLLREDPLADIDATDTIDTVFTGGRMLNRKSLDGLLEAVREANAKSREEDIQPFL